MKLFLTNQKASLQKHLTSLKLQPVMKYDPTQLREKVSIIRTEKGWLSFAEAPFHDLNLGFLFNYNIFPPNIMTHLTEWNAENRKMQPGDTIVQQVFLPPTPAFSFKIILGVRICEIIDLPNKKGFSYETLEGHVECGISTFTAECENDLTIFKIHTFSKPGNFLSRMGAPFFSNPYQNFCTRSALQNLKNQAELS